MRSYPRRRVLALGVGLIGSSAIAGCVGQSGGGTAGTSAQASFFVFGDFASQVAGEAAASETLVPVGQHGHGWEPGPRVQEAILQSDLFVYGMPGFQPWADDIVRDLEADDHDVTVVEAAADIEFVDDDDGHDADGHDAGRDPHFWLDPLRAIQAVDTIRAGFDEVDPEAAETYDRAANRYRDRLDDLHDRFQTTLADRSHDVIFVAGHDAFAYLHDRYDIRIESLTGLAPDDRPSPRDIERAQRLIADHGIEYLCADPLESQRAADQLVAETDARAVLPLTAIPGRTEAWRDRDWGYEAIMANVNLPTLERALTAT